MDNTQAPQTAPGGQFPQMATTPPQPATPMSGGALPPAEYISNPFLVGLRSIIAGLKTNPVAIMLTPLVVIAAFLVLVLVAGILAATRSSGGNALAILLMLVTYLLILPVVVGMYYTIAAHSDKGETITTKEAFNAALGKALPMLGLIVVSVLATGIGLILLIVPGVIFMVRASLAPTVMYFEDLGVFAAIKRSFSLTKGHFLETLGALIAGGFLGSNGLIAPYYGIAQMVGRYNDYKTLQESGAARPKVHWLNYVPVILLIIFGALYAMLVVTFANVQKRANDSLQKSQQLQRQNLDNNSFYNPYRNDSGSSSDYRYDY